MWRWQGAAVTVLHSKGVLDISNGVLDIARLLERLGQEIHALDLMSPTGAAPDTGGTGPILDDTARREGRVARLEHEREHLVAEITRGYGLGGRARTVGHPVERARKAVGMRIATAIKAVAATDSPSPGTWIAAPSPADCSYFDHRT